MKEKKANRNRTMVARIKTFVKNFFLEVLAIISIVYTKVKKNERVKNALHEVIPAIITWIVIGVIVAGAFFALIFAICTPPTNGPDVFKSKYSVDQEELNKATEIFREEQKNKSSNSDISSVESPVEAITPENSSTAEKVDDHKKDDDNKISTNLTESEICILCQAVQHETGTNPDFFPNGDFDIVQQYMAASILNRIGQPGFGSNYTTANSLYEVLANPIQYGNMLWELDQFAPYDERTLDNIYRVLTGTANIPAFLYFERCSNVGEDYWSAQNSFYEQYGYDSTIKVAYMSQTLEGRFIIFATNVNGAYAN